MFDQWILSGWNEIPWVLLSGLCTYVAILVYTRVAGLRSFSKMSAGDFAMTVAVGSLFASTAAMSTPSLVVGLTALASLFLGQYVLARIRSACGGCARLIDNQPLLLMAGPTILHENLKRANVTVDDLHGKLREANALAYDRVLAVVFETTGDVSVLHSNDPGARLEPALMSDVSGAERLFPVHRDA